MTGTRGIVFKLINKKNFKMSSKNNNDNNSDNNINNKTLEMMIKKCRDASTQCGNSLTIDEENVFVMVKSYSPINVELDADEDSKDEVKIEDEVVDDGDDDNKDDIHKVNFMISIKSF